MSLPSTAQAQTAEPSRVLGSAKSPKVWGTMEREARNLHL